MPKVVQCSAIALAAAICTSAASATTVSGKYALLATAQCEARLSVNKSKDGFVVSTDVSEFGPTVARTGYVTFKSSNATSGKASGSITEVRGGSLRVNSNGASVTVKTLGFNSSYAMTATTMKLGTDTFTASFADIVGGVAHVVNLVRKEPNANCIDAMTLTHE
jgi:hypothetical protein